MDNFKKKREAILEDLWLNENLGPSIVSRGFDAAIALDLPVKFAEWKDLSLESFELRRLADFTYQIDGEDATLTNKELYQYWIENIYTHE